ncbi:MAG: hypothetical protein AAGB31_03555 [Bdellovibrio sp.]
MFSRILKMIFCCQVIAALAWANEGGGGGEHGAAPAAAAEAPKEIKSNEDSYAVVQARVQALEAKVHSGETEIQKLLLEKQHASDPEKANEIIRQMITLHHELEKNNKEYDQQRSLLKYRYPEKGLQGQRVYERIDVKSLEEMESQMSLSASLKKALRKVRIQYETPEEVVAEQQKKEEAQHSRKPAEAPSGLIEPVILKK